MGKIMSRRSALAVASVAIVTPASAALSAALPVAMDAAIIPINAAATRNSSPPAAAIAAKMQRILGLTDWADRRALKSKEWSLHDALWERYEELGRDLLDIPAQSTEDMLRKLEWGFPDLFGEHADDQPDSIENVTIRVIIDDLRALGGVA